LAFKRQVMKDTQGRATVMYEINPVFLERLQEAGFSQDAIDRVVEHACEKGTIEGSPVELPAALLRTFRPARAISPGGPLPVQAAWQRHTDAAVSKTINFASEASQKDVERACLLAYETGCKGITVYRDNSRADQPMALDDKKSAAPAAPPASREKTE